jgi:hypothetical protein
MGRPKKKINNIPKPEFLECYDEILSVVNSRRFKWHLDSVPSISWDDIKQIILNHLFIKWHLFDPNKGSLKTWVLVVSSNQIRNQLRNHYGSFQKVCVRCDQYEGNDLCKKFGTCDSSKCELLKMWETRKKSKHDISLALPIENHLNECHEITQENIDVDKTAIVLHARMKEVLKPFDWAVYEMLFVKNMSEEAVAKILKFKTNEPGRTAGYKQINNIKKRIMILVREVLNKEDIEIIKN